MGERRREKRALILSARVDYRACITSAHRAGCRSIARKPIMSYHLAQQWIADGASSRSQSALNVQSISESRTAPEEAV